MDWGIVISLALGTPALLPASRAFGKANASIAHVFTWRLHLFTS
ncbi:hypothetical protein CSE45_4407 [Citreicella sp. SE45]|nr:hypothetical protein CSE45_4407 [Citreicella sp. SE45]